ncbi:MAG: RNase P modulator RnpM [Suipraeoptans sp.]
MKKTKNKKIPMRKCVGCQELKNKSEMIRIVKTEDEGFLLDDTGKKNGRGAYICPNISCLELALKTRGLEKSFKCTIPEKVYETLLEAMKSIDDK